MLSIRFAKYFQEVTFCNYAIINFQLAIPMDFGVNSGERY